MSAKNLAGVLRALRSETLVITPRYNSWLMRGGIDEPLRDDVMEKIREALQARQRDRWGSFSSSSAGMCERRQLLQFCGVQTPGDFTDVQLQNIFNDGRWRHLRWQAALLQAYIIDEMEYKLDWPNKRHRGAMDGHGIVPADHKTWGGAEFGWELKGVSTFQFGKYRGDEAKKEHLKQIARNDLMGGWDIFVTIYEDKTTQEWMEWVTIPNKKMIQDQKDEIDRLNDAVDNSTLPLMLPDCKRRTGPVFANCPFNDVCHKQGTWPKIKREKARG